jgi:hypothetical protein
VLDQFYYDDSNWSLGQPDPSQAIRHDVEVLMSLPESEVRFTFDSHNDYAEGLIESSLTLFFGESRKATLEYTTTYHSDVSNGGELTAKAPDSVHGDEELHTTLAWGSCRCRSHPALARSLPLAGALRHRWTGLTYTKMNLSIGHDEPQ